MKNSYLWALLLVPILTFAGCESEENISGEAGQGGFERDPLMEYKSAEIGPEGGTLNLSFSEFSMPKKALKEKTLISIARYGISREPSPYDYYILLPAGMRFDYRPSILVVTGRDHSDVYPAGAAFGYLKEDDFWRVPTQTVREFGFFLGFFWSFDKVGIRENTRKKSDLCPSKNIEKSQGVRNDIKSSGQSYVGKCFEADYKLTSDGRENYGAICHKGLAGNFLCDSCIVEKKCGNSSRLYCCHTCQVDPNMQNDFKCSEEDLSLIAEDLDCGIEEYEIDCADINSGSMHLGGYSAETEVLCAPQANKEVLQSIKNGKICVTIKTKEAGIFPSTIMRYPKLSNVPMTCKDALEIFDCEPRAHEREHYKKGLAACNEMLFDLQNISSLAICSSDPDLALSEANNDYDEKFFDAIKISMKISQETQDRFDLETNHGNVPFSCSC